MSALIDGVNGPDPLDLAEDADGVDCCFVKDAGGCAEGDAAKVNSFSLCMSRSSPRRRYCRS